MLECGSDVEIDINCLFEGCVQLADGVRIGAHCVIRNARIEAGAVIHPFTHIDGETLGVKIGDRLGFDIAGQLREGRITSLRKVDWSSMRVNFFVMFPKAEMPGLPLSYISAFRAPDTPGFDNRLSRDFPNITNVDISASIGQVQRVLDQVIRAVEFVTGQNLWDPSIRFLTDLPSRSDPMEMPIE